MMDKKFLCKERNEHKDCAYCGYGGPCTHICGICKENGIDGAGDLDMFKERLPEMINKMNAPRN